MHGDFERPERKSRKPATSMQKVENLVKDTNKGQRRSYHMAQEKKELLETAGRWRSLWEVNHSSKNEQKDELSSKKIEILEEKKERG